MPDPFAPLNKKSIMAQIDDFFMYENRVEGITDADYQRVQPYVEAVLTKCLTLCETFPVPFHRSANSAVAMAICFSVFMFMY